MEIPVKCRSCGAEVSNTARFCPSCGAPIVSGEDATVGGAPAEPSPGRGPRPTPPAGAKPPHAGSGPEAPRSSSSPSELPSEGRFLPGALLAGRYRIVAALGKGGMGEVYRADDLTLRQPVALKFLPEAAAQDPATLERFRNEVRTSRRVSHANVCRVYDLGEVEGQTFLSMEYVDGEDLASLLRRIGRLPGDKALEIARQLCAGLAAAHREGILHRDLKPANVMLDGRGRAVMTDFGLASFADQVTGHEVRSGTPAYMAPEQLAGREVTASSDIYSLGLVMYEIFTGKRAYDAEKLADLVKQRQEKPPSHPSSLVKDMDPAVERVILRCLERDPANRPPSALAVAAALPGGDPLAAALAAGETPSPQMVAAAGETGVLKPRVGAACLGAVIAGLIGVVILGARIGLLELMRPPYSPEALTLKAQEMIKSLGYTDQPADSASGFFYQDDLYQYVQKNDRPRPLWSEVISARPSMLSFWYRASPRALVATDFKDDALTPGLVTAGDPPPILSGMIHVDLDCQGRLAYLEAIPPEEEKQPEAQPLRPADWNALFAAAGLDATQFKSAPPAWNSLAASDARAAWTGTWPGTSRPLRVEAAAWHGRPVYFALIGPWTKPPRMEQGEGSAGSKAAGIILLSMAILVLIGAVLLAWRNYVQGKGDRRGAIETAWAIFVVEMALWLCRGHFVPTEATFGLFVLAVSTSLFWALMLWLMYLGLEPYVRRRWPQSIISWSRLVAGQWRDPVVGRDVLFGVMLGLVWVLMFTLRYLLMQRLGAGPAYGSAAFLQGARSTLGAWMQYARSSITGTLIFFFLLFLLRVLLRKQWLAVVAFTAIFATIPTLQGDYPKIDFPAMALIYGIAAIALVRFGLVVLAVGIFTVNLLLSAPLTLHFSSWYGGSAAFVLLSLLALAAWGFYSSLGGQQLLQGDLFE